MIQTRLTDWMDETERKLLIEIENKKRKPWINWEKSLPLTEKYKEIKIPKRKGGFRIIQIPPDELKKVQKEILSFLRRLWKVHHLSIKGLRKQGGSYVDHAKYHSSSRFIFQLDIKDAFPSVKIPILYKALLNVLLSEGIVESEAEANKVTELVIKLTTFKEKLPQGAPTSPFLFYVYLLELKLIERLYDCCRELENVRISCYVDNITISSSSFILPEIRKKIITEIEKCGFRVNEQKIWFKDCRQGAPIITGIRVHGDGKISIPKKKIRKWRGIIYRVAKSQELTEETKKRIQGFIASLKPIYGEKLPPQIQKPYQFFLSRSAGSFLLGRDIFYNLNKFFCI
jgi:hypothetical protein